MKLIIFTLLTVNIFAAWSFEWTGYESAYNETTKQLNQYRVMIANITYELENSLEIIGKPIAEIEDSIEKQYQNKAHSYLQNFYYIKVETVEDEANANNIDVHECNVDIDTTTYHNEFMTFIKNCHQLFWTVIQQPHYRMRNQFVESLNEKQAELDDCQKNKTGFAQLRCISEVSISALPTFFKIDKLVDLSAEVIKNAKSTVIDFSKGKCLINTEVRQFWKNFESELNNLEHEVVNCMYDVIEESSKTTSEAPVTTTTEKIVSTETDLTTPKAEDVTTPEYEPETTTEAETIGSEATDATFESSTFEYGLTTSDDEFTTPEV